METESATGSLSEIRPHVKLRGAVAASFAAEDPKPIVTLIQQGPVKYLVRVLLPGPAKQLHGLAFLMEGDRTMHLKGTLENVNHHLASSSSPASRIRRFYPPALFSISFDFPEQIVPRIFEPRRQSDGTFEFAVFRPTELHLQCV